jgi:hypothetical protein
LLAVMVAGISAALAVPRAVPPFELPEPFIAPRDLEEVARTDQALAEAAERDGLDTDVRFLGTAIRAYNRADASGIDEAVVQEKRHVGDAAKLASAQGEGALARLRAYQLRSFLRELRRWEQTGTESDELHELGGNFLDQARKDGWVDGRHLLADETVRATWYKLRWMQITMAHGPSLALAPVEEIAVARFHLLHPPHAPGPVGRRLRAVAGRNPDNDDASYQIKQIDTIHALDPDYPTHLARGVVFFRHHSYEHAADELKTYLEDYPSGPYRLRAQNYLAAALQGATEPP